MKEVLFGQGGFFWEKGGASCDGRSFSERLWRRKLVAERASCYKEEQAAARERVCFLCCGEEVLKLFGDGWRSSFLRGDAELSGDQRRNSEL